MAAELAGFRRGSGAGYSEGFDFVLVNGKIAVDEGKLTPARGGRTPGH
jgi:hypothetical protein